MGLAINTTDSEGCRPLVVAKALHPEIIKDRHQPFENLEQQIEAATSDEQRELLREQALRVLATARSDFFVEPKSRQWYVDREASLEGK